MQLAPEPYLTAYLDVLHFALAAARSPIERGEWSHQQIRDLCDVLHNIPDLLHHWDECDEPELRSWLEHYDKRWEHAPMPLDLSGHLHRLLERDAEGPA